MNFRTLAALALAAAWSFTAAPDARAAEDPAGFTFYEKQAKDVLRSAGAKVWEAADEARKQGFHQFAIQQAERALEFDPDQKEAREHLKYTKKEGKWVQDAEAYSAMPQSNSKSQQESQAGYDKRIKKWEEEVLVRTDKFVAARYAELGDICASKGYRDQANKGYESALRLDKENERARKGLGYIKFGKSWLTKKQDEARKAASKSEVVKEAELTMWDELCGKKLNKVQSMHFRFESGFPVEELQSYATAAETAYAYYLADFGKDPGEEAFEGRQMLFFICENDDQWNKLVDRFGGGDKEFTRQLSGTSLGDLGRGIRSGAGSTQESRRDMVVHQTVHALNQKVWRVDSDRGRAWLNEGLTYYYSLKVLESCLTHCVAKTKSDYAGAKDGGSLKKWDQPDGWKGLLKTQVQKKDDIPLRSLMMLPITRLDFKASVKAWSVASWLMDLDRDKFTSVLDQMLDPAVKQEMVFQGTYGKGLEELDEDWHRYVLRCY